MSRRYGCGILPRQSRREIQASRRSRRHEIRSPSSARARAWRRARGARAAGGGSGSSARPSRSAQPRRKRPQWPLRQGASARAASRRRHDIRLRARARRGVGGSRAVRRARRPGLLGVRGDRRGQAAARPALGLPLRGGARPGRQRRPQHPRRRTGGEQRNARGAGVSRDPGAATGRETRTRREHGMKPANTESPPVTAGRTSNGRHPGK